MLYQYNHCAIRYCLNSTLLVLLLCFAINAAALDLDIADIPLEVAPTAPSNVLLLLDNSESMDWDVLTQDAVSSGLFNAPNPDGTGGFANITQRLPDGDGAADANCISIASMFGGYAYGVAFLSNQNIPATPGSENCFVADDDAWRFRNNEFNPFYFDPNETYQPWAGEYDLDGDGDTEPFPPADINNAVDNPINPQHTINLTLHKTGLDSSGNRIDGVGLKYYDWDDASGNNDGNFDNGEEVEFLIRDQDAATQQNFANWFVYHRSREFTTKAILSELVTGTAAARVGLGVFNSSGSSGFPVALLNPLPSAGNKRALLETIFETQLAPGSPIRASLEKAGLYFECKANDIFGSAGASSPGSATCPLLASPAGSCQSNQVIMLTDSFQDSFVSSSGIADDDSDNNTDFDGGAFADSNPSTLADIAMNFYERDLHDDFVLRDEVPITLTDLLSYPRTPALRLDDTLHQHMKTNIVSLGLQGTGISKPTDPSAAFAWTDHNNPGSDGAEFVDGMLHAAYNGRGRFLQAFGSSDLKQQLESVFKSANTASIANATLAFNTRSITEGTVVYRTFSSLAANSGDVVSQNVLPDGTLEVDASNDPIFVWQAAPSLETRQPSDRVMITYSDVLATLGGREFNLGPNGLVPSQSNNLAIPVPANVTPPSAIVNTRVNYLRGSRDDEGNDFDSGDMRTRVDLSTAIDEVGLGGKIGDIVHSGPIFVGAPQFTQRFGGAWPGGDDSYAIFRDDPINQNREQLIYVGSNAGMLHAFQAVDGVEKFAYVPNVLLNELGEFTSPDYSHRFYVDATPRVNDAFIDPAGGSSRAWNSILIGGLGAGGKGYYALNITDPSEFNTQANAVNQVLWEFTTADDGGAVSDLGFTFSEPIIGMSNSVVNGEQEWVAIFGNGYNSTNASGNAVIYILFIEQGIDGWSAGEFIKIDTGEGFSSAGNVAGIRNGIADIRGIDEDGNGTLDRLYAGDFLGNVYVANISSSDSDDWNNSSNLEIIFKARFGNSFPRNEIQPITTRPEVIKHPSADGFIVIVATGSYFTNGDATSTAIQSIYGLWDDSPAFSDVGIGGNFPIEFKNPSSSDQLIEQTITASLNGTELVRTSSDNSVTWDNTTANQVRGWHIDFDVPPPPPATGIQFPGERAVRGLVIQEGILFYNTVIPQDGAFCEAPEGGFISGLNPETGGSGIAPIFDINNDAVIDLSDYLNSVQTPSNIIVGVKTDSGLGDTIVLENYVGGGTLDGGSKFIRIAEQDTTNADIAPLLGRHSWKQIEY